MENVFNSNAYKVWEYDQLEPEEKLRSGFKKLKQRPGWILKGAGKEHPTEAEMLKKENEFLSKYGIFF